MTSGQEREGLDLEAAHRDLVAWGLLDETGRATRRLQGAWMRAAAALAAQEQKGNPVPGDPRRNVAAAVLEEVSPGAWVPVQRDLLVAAQLLRT